MLFFTLLPITIDSRQKNAVLGLTFVSTYLIPILVLFILKYFSFIKSYHVNSIKERKIPILLMILIFYILGNTLYKNPFIRDLGTLFYATSLGLIIIYILFIFKLKTSLHLLSLGVSVGFFLMLSIIYVTSFLPLVYVLVLISGVVASSRLYLKVHTPKEIYLGFFIGVISPFVANYIL